MLGLVIDKLTLALLVLMVNAGASHEDVMNDGECTFTPDPLPMYIADACVVQSSSSVHQHATAMHITCERNLLRVEVVKA